MVTEYVKVVLFSVLPFYASLLCFCRPSRKGGKTRCRGEAAVQPPLRSHRTHQRGGGGHTQRTVRVK